MTINKFSNFCRLLFPILAICGGVFHSIEGKNLDINNEEIVDTIFISERIPTDDNITANAYIFRDSTLQLNFQEVQSTAKFEPYNKKQLLEGPNAIYWLKFTISNQDSFRNKIKIHTNSIDIFHIQLFATKGLNEKKIFDRKGNIHTSNATSALINGYEFYEEILGLETKTYYLVLDHHQLLINTKVSIDIYRSKDFYSNQFNNFFIFSVAVVFVYLLLILAIFIQYSTYLNAFFFVYVLGGSLYMLGAWGVGMTYFWGLFLPSFQSPAPYMGSIITLLGFTGMFKEYFDIKNRNSKLNQVLKFLIIFDAAIVIILLFWQYLPDGLYLQLIELGLSTYFIGLPIFFCFGFYFYFQTKETKLLLFLFVFLLFLCTAIGLILTSAQVIPPSDLVLVYSPAINLFFEVSLLIFLISKSTFAKEKALTINLEKNKLKAQFNAELVQTQADFYTKITHEFRTPLTVIQGMANEIKASKAKQLILKNTDYLLDMINQILQLAKLESGTIPFRPVQSDIIPFLSYQAEAWTSFANTKLISLIFYSRLNELVMDFDAKKLAHILTNLLSNALKFTPQYGKIQIVAAKENDFIKITIKDTGSGISAEELPYIFDKYYQTSNNETQPNEGTGIGLALVQQLVQISNGKIEVNSQLNKGTTFTVSLPITNLAPKEVKLPKNNRPILINEGISSKETTNPNTPLTIERPTVLIIEDNSDIISFIQTILKNDYHLLSAKNGKVGIEMAIAHLPTIILCDVMMPEVDGLEVCKTLKETLSTAQIPIILLSAKSSQTARLSGLSQGADAYLTKPFVKEELLVQMTNLIDLRKRLNYKFAQGTLPKDSNPTVISKKDQLFLEKLTTYIQANLAKDHLLEVANLQRVVKMSRPNLHKKLKALTGMNTSQFRKTIRLQAARKLLASDTDFTVSEVAYKVGYKHPSHFSRDFKEVFGLSPKEC